MARKPINADDAVTFKVLGLDSEYTGTEQTISNGERMRVTSRTYLLAGDNPLEPAGLGITDDIPFQFEQAGKVFNMRHTMPFVEGDVIMCVPLSPLPGKVYRRWRIIGKIGGIAT